MARPKPGPGRRPDHLSHLLHTSCRTEGAGGARVLLSRKSPSSTSSSKRGRTSTGRGAGSWNTSRPSGTRSPQTSTPSSGPMRRASAGDFPMPWSTRQGSTTWRRLRSIQDCNVKLALESVPGVSQVACVGGFVKQYQVTVDPQPPRGLQHPHHKGHGGDQEEQPRRGRTGARALGRRVHGPGQGLHQGDRRIWRDIPVGTDGGGTPVLPARTSPRAARPGDQARPGGPGRQGRGGRRHRRRALR